MKLHLLYVDKNGESHFKDVEVELVDEILVAGLRGGGCFRRPRGASGSGRRQSPGGVLRLVKD